MVAPSTDRNLYDLFKRVVRATSQAFPNAWVNVTLTGTRPDGSTYDFRRELIPSEQEEIPWDVHDAIIDVIWYPYGDSSSDLFNRGIGVVTCFGFRSQHAVGITGVVKTNTPRFNPEDSDQMERHGLPNADAVIQKVLDVVSEAYEEVATERSYEDEYY